MGKCGTHDVNNRNCEITKCALPNHSHHLASNHGITAVRANTEVKICRELRIGSRIADGHGLVVEIGHHDFVIEKYTDVRGSSRSFQ